MSINRKQLLIFSQVFFVGLGIVLVFFFLSGSSSVFGHGSSPVVNTSCGLDYSVSCELFNDCTWCHMGDCWTVVDPHGPDPSCEPVCSPFAGFACDSSVCNVCGDCNYGGELNCEATACINLPSAPPLSCTQDCAGVWGGGAVDDVCGVCGGDGSSCVDQCGVPFGSDACVDQCGVPFGSDACLDCAGVPYGGVSYDVCGVCGGSGSSCLDCAGVPYGGASYDVCGVCGGDGSSCANNPPSSTNHTVGQGDNCGVASPTVTLSWTFTDPDGHGQSAYQIKIKQGVSIIYSPEKIISSSQQYSPPLGTLSYNTIYTWELKVWDNYSSPLESGWITVPAFTTPVHQYPIPSFTWLPLIPGQNESTSFFDTSTTYGGSFIASWQWAFEDGTPVSSVQQNPIVAFSYLGSKQVDLQATDSSGFSCSTSQNVGVGIPFPEWEEVPPFGVILNLLSSFVSLFSAVLP